MATVDQVQIHHGTILTTFTQTGTYSTTVDLSGCSLVALYSDNWPSAAGSLVLRSSWSPIGTGYPVQTSDGTPVKVLAFGSGTYYVVGEWPYETHGIQFLTLQVGTAGTAGIAGGGTIVLVGDAKK